VTLVEYTRDGTIVNASATNTNSVTFFVPCYNEERNIVSVLKKLENVAQGLRLKFEILIFDDCSKDGTLGVVRAYQQSNPQVPLRIFSNDVNQGIAKNFVEGAFHGTCDYYRMVCGDDVESVETLRTLLEHIGKADMVIPYHTRVRGRTLWRRILSRTYTILVNFASGRHLHYYNGLPIFRRRDVMRFHVEANGSGHQAEFLLRLLQEGRSFVEIPVTAEDHSSGSLNFRNFVSVGYSIFKIVIGRIRNLSRGQQARHGSHS
jgi:glycosyltransferase involved in cell wall biosynthesis